MINKSYLEKTIFKKFKKDLVEKYGTDIADEIWQNANAEYLKLEVDEPDADKASRSYVFPVVAIYRAVETYAPEEVFETTRAFGTKMGLQLKYLCATDHVIPKLIHAKLIRTHTCALGSDSCDYWYVGDESETAKNFKGELV